VASTHLGSSPERPSGPAGPSDSADARLSAFDGAVGLSPAPAATPTPPGGAHLRVLLVAASLVLSVVIGLLLSRQGRGAPGGERAGGRASGRVSIGLSLDTLKEERWQRDRAAFVARASALGADVIDLSANSNDTQQVRDVESLITSRVDVLVIVAHNGAAMAKAVGLAHAAGIPVVAYDRLIPDCDLDFYITFDAVKVGALQARYLIEHLRTPGRGRIVRLHGAKTDHNSHLIKKGQDEVLEPLVQRGDLQVVHEDWVDEWRPENAKRIVNAALTRVLARDGDKDADKDADKDRAGDGPPLDGILTPNDGTAGGAVQALREEGLDGKVVVTGQDAELAACQRVLAGSQTMTVYKPLPKLASRAAEIAVAMARGKPVVARAETDNGRIKVPSLFIDVIAVDKGNVFDTVARDGFHSADAIRGK
jgi:D-xylose transport system substrate-binding protein